jgi:hypothetical protein
MKKRCDQYSHVNASPYAPLFHLSHFPTLFKNVPDFIDEKYDNPVYGTILMV